MTPMHLLLLVFPFLSQWEAMSFPLLKRGLTTRRILLLLIKKPSSFNTLLFCYCCLRFSISGCTDHYAATEEEGFECGRDVVATFNIPETIEPEGYEEPLYDPSELPGLIPQSQQHTMDMYKVC